MSLEGEFSLGVASTRRFKITMGSMKDKGVFRRGLTVCSSEDPDP